MVDEESAKHFSYRFSAAELQLPNYIPIADRRMPPKAD